MLLVADYNISCLVWFRIIAVSILLRCLRHIFSENSNRCSTAPLLLSFLFSWPVLHIQKPWRNPFAYGTKRHINSKPGLISLHFHEWLTAKLLEVPLYNYHAQSDQLPLSILSYEIR